MERKRYTGGGGVEGECSRRVDRGENVVEDWREEGMHCRGRGREDYAEEGRREGDAVEGWRVGDVQGVRGGGEGGG